MNTFKVITRRRIEVNTDPQRRCYNGCHFSSEFRWTEWETLDSGLTEEKARDKLTFWRELNDYAIKARGEGARCEFTYVGDT